MMIDPKTGLVISYNFLWPHEHDHGKEDGRKARPTCVVVPLTTKTSDVVLFPLTTKEPSPDRLAVRVPETERRRLNLRGYGPSWVILDEANTDFLPDSFHVEPVTYDPPVMHYGKFSRAFMGQILKVLAQAIREKRVRLVNRNPSSPRRSR